MADREQGEDQRLVEVHQYGEEHQVEGDRVAVAQQHLEVGLLLEEVIQEEGDREEDHGGRTWVLRGAAHPSLVLQGADLALERLCQFPVLRTQDV